MLDQLPDEVVIYILRYLPLIFVFTHLRSVNKRLCALITNDKSLVRYQESCCSPEFEIFLGNVYPGPNRKGDVA